MSDSNTIKVDVDAGAALAVLRPLQVASDLIAAAAGRTVTVEQSIALLQEARQWITLSYAAHRPGNPPPSDMGGTL